MKMQLILPTFLAMFFFVLQGQAQSFSYSGYFGTHEYDITEAQDIGTLKSPFGDKTIVARLGKNSSRGYFLLTIQNAGSEEVITGDIMIMTHAGQRIKCRDRKIRSNQNRDGVQVTSTLYYLTFSELKLLEKHGISRIIFQTKLHYYEDEQRYSYGTSTYFY